MQRFAGKIAVVTGAGTGIGRAVSVAFAQHGARVYLAGRRLNLLHDTAAEISAAGGLATCVPTDVANPHDVAQLFRVVGSSHDCIDIVVNAAGVMHVGSLHETTEEEFNNTFDTNVKGLWLVSKFAIPYLRGRAGANIINISSVAGLRHEQGLGSYEASKAAVNTITKVMAKELAKERIRVNAIAPGPIDTALFRGSPLGDDTPGGRQKEDSSSSVPFGRLGTPDEVARLALFLASPESDFISGSITAIDGAMGY